MRVLFVLGLLISMLFGDFYIVDGDKKVKMTPLETGKIDFSTFRKIAHIKRSNNELHAFGDEIAFNHRHLNFRLATIGLVQTNYTITEWSEKAKESSDSYYINFDNYTREDGVMLQLFYKNRWYAVVLGDPLKILHKLFLGLDIHSKDLDLEKAMKAIKQARAAYPLDDKLKMVEMELDNKRANELEHLDKTSTSKYEPVKVFFN